MTHNQRHTVMNNVSKMTHYYCYARFVFVSYMNVVALSYFAAKAAGHGQTAVQKGHAETPAKLRSGLTLQTRETPESTTTCNTHTLSVSRDIRR